jgi:hypothetical protein
MVSIPNNIDMFPWTATPSFDPKNPVDMFPWTPLANKTPILSSGYVSMDAYNITQ